MSGFAGLSCGSRPVFWPGLGGGRWVWQVLAGVLALGLGAGLGSAAYAQSGRAGQTLDFTVQKSTSLDVHGEPSLSLAQLGVPKETDDGAAAYTIQTNTGKPRDIRASLDQAVPEGLTLEAYVDAPESNGNTVSSTGWTTLSPDAQVVVERIQKADDENVPITYRATATPGASPGSYVFTVTYTISSAN